MAYIYLRIGTDPTAWVLENAEPDTVAAQLSQATGPVVLPVTAPLLGNLVVAPPSAATISLQPPAPTFSAHPSHIALPRASVLYLPSSTGPTPHFPGYPLPLGTDLAALEQDIIAAMSGRTFLSIQIADIPGGVVLLNGAALPYAVLAQLDA